MHVRTWSVAPWWAVAALAGATGSAAATVGVPGLVGRIVSDLASGRDASGALALLAGVLVLSRAGTVLFSLAVAAFATVVTTRTRAEAARSLMARDELGQDVGDLVTRFLVDARQPAGSLPLVTVMCTSVGTATFCLVQLARLDLWLLAAAGGALAAMVFVIGRFVSDTEPALHRYRQAQGELADRLVEARRGAAGLRALGHWRSEVTRVLVPLPALSSAGTDLWRVQSRFAWRSGALAPVLQLLVIATGSVLLATGRLGIGGLVAAVGYANVLLGAFEGFEAAAGLGLVRVGRARVSDILDRPRPVTGSATAPGGHRVDVRLEGVTVVRDGRALLDEVSLHVPGGSWLTVTGPSDACAALAGVIAGTNSPQHGRVYLGGVPLDALDPAQRASSVVLGSARPPLLGDTVSGLIGLGAFAMAAPGRDERVRAAAEVARIADVIDGLPDGYATALEDLALSGGELQRLGIAQAVVGDPAVLVLDAATTSLDPATEREVLRAIAAARRNRTCIVLTRPGAHVRLADRCLHLGDGRIRRGSPDVLVGEAS